MKIKMILRSLAGALCVCAAAYADGVTLLPVNVKVVNTNANPVPTAPQGTTQVSGAVDIVSAPPITGSVAVNNEPTVNLAPGSSVAVSGSVNVANEPTVNLAAGATVGISGTPSVSLAGTPAVAVSGLQFDSGGNLKVTGGSGSMPSTTVFARETLSGVQIFPFPVVRPGFGAVHSTAEFAKVRIHGQANCDDGASASLTIISWIDRAAGVSFVLDRTGDLCASTPGSTAEPLGTYDAVFDVPGTEIQFRVDSTPLKGIALSAFGR
jgi:hypothetical protein